MKKKSEVVAVPTPAIVPIPPKPAVVSPPPVIKNIAPPELVIPPPPVKPGITTAQRAALDSLIAQQGRAQDRLNIATSGIGFGETMPPDISPVDSTAPARDQATIIRKNISNIVAACASVLLLQRPTGDNLKRLAIKARALGIPGPPALTSFDVATTSAFALQMQDYNAKYQKILGTVPLPHTIFDPDFIGAGFDPDHNLEQKIGEAIYSVDRSDWNTDDESWIDKIRAYYTANPDAPRFYSPI